jgi:diglucosylglycerate octanoyltransferase
VTGGPLRRVLVIGDSLVFHGPERGELSTHPGLWPNVLAEQLGAEVDVVARLGWTARDAWWALTRDVHVYSVLLPRADALVLAVGGMDALPASLPTYLREGIAYLRPGRVRRPVRRAFLAAHPRVVRLTGRWMRVLPQAATDSYLSRCVRAVRVLHPQTTIVAMTPSPHDAKDYGHVTSGHLPSVEASRAWARREGVPLVELDPVVGPSLAAGGFNADGMHYGWDAHADVAAAVAETLVGGRRRH